MQEQASDRLVLAPTTCTTTMTALDVQRAMLAVMLTMTSEGNEAAADGDFLIQHMTTMAAAYRDLAVQLGIVLPAGIEALLA